MTKKKKGPKLTPRDARLKRLYGLEPGEYEKILNYQGGVCFICNRPPKEGKNLHVDHSHISGLTRGLLCWKDNAALGKFNDNLTRLQNAYEYIIAPPSRFALKRDVYGRTGRVTNKRKRKKTKSRKVKK